MFIKLLTNNLRVYLHKKVTFIIRLWSDVIIYTDKENEQDAKMRVGLHEGVNVNI